MKIIFKLFGLNFAAVTNNNVQIDRVTGLPVLNPEIRIGSSSCATRFDFGMTGCCPGRVDTCLGCEEGAESCDGASGDCLCDSECITFNDCCDDHSVTCLALYSTTTQTTTTTAEIQQPIANIYDMINHMDKNKNELLSNYGCAGVLSVDTPYKLPADAGKPVDELDLVISKWKRCIQCVESSNSVAYSEDSYIFDQSSNICIDNPTTSERSFCECDLSFATAVSSLSATWWNYDTENCLKSIWTGPPRTLECCFNPSTAHYTSYYTSDHECCGDTVVSIGSC